jgi:hypothetical protein
MSDALEALLLEVRKNDDLSSLHPLKLDRWHRALVGLPPAIYMQYGCFDLWQQVGRAAAALETMVNLLGTEGLPVTPHELAQRTIQTFRWYVPSTPLEALVGFQASWDKKASSWKLTLPEESSAIKSVPTLEAALEKSKEWADSLEPGSDFDDEIHEEAPDEG